MPDPPRRRCRDGWFSVMRKVADPAPLRALAARDQDIAPKEMGLRARIVETRKERIEWEVLGHRTDVRSLRLHHPVCDCVARSQEGVEHNELTVRPQPRDCAVGTRERAGKARERQAEYDGVNRTKGLPSYGICLQVLDV